MATSKKSESGRGAIVVVGATKGGVGKSSLAWEIAQGFARAGTQTCLIDGDETATVAAMYDHRMNNEKLRDAVGPTVVIAPTQIERMVVDMARTNDLVVVDLGARDWSRYQSLPLAADLWVVPTDFSSGNMTPAAQMFAEHMWPKRGRHHTGGPVPIRLAWSKTPNNTGNTAWLERCMEWWEGAIENITGLSARDTIRRTGRRFHPDTGFDVFDTQLRLRQAPWEEALNRGASLAELPASIGGKAAAEVEALVAEVNQALINGSGARA